MKLRLNFLKNTLLKHYPIFLSLGIILVLLIGFYLLNSPIQRIQASPASCDLVMQVSPSGSGTTEPPKGDHWYECNQYIGIAAHPASGYAFDYWAGDVSGTSNPTTIWLDKNKVASAHFKTTTPCSCGDWTGHGCGSVGCGSQYLGFTRSCNPSGCDQETKCVYDVTCGAAVCGNGICETGENNSTCPNDCPPPSNCNCTSWTSQGCGGAGCASQYLGYTRSCNPSGCAAEKTCVYDVTCGAAVCGNGICETGENSSTCPGDCPVVGYRCDQIGCSPGATWCLSNNYCLYTSGSSCKYGNYCPPSGTKSGNTCYYQRVGCNSSGQCNVQTCIIGAGQTCTTLGCTGGGCTNDNGCTATGVKRCDPANNTRYQTCGQYDIDTCLDWSPSMPCASGQTCSGAGSCGGVTNQPPSTPSKPSGPTLGKTNTSYTFSTSTTDPNGDQVKYGWDWDGNSTVDEWSGLKNSGAADSRSHSWTAENTYNVKVKAKDSKGAESGWSSALTVSITSSGGLTTFKLEVPLYHQDDLQWGTNEFYVLSSSQRKPAYIPYQNDNCKLKSTINISGCAPTSAEMILAYYNKGKGVVETANAFTDKGCHRIHGSCSDPSRPYYSKGSDLPYFAPCSGVLTDAGLSYTLVPIALANIASEISMRRPVLLSVSAGCYGATHAMVAIGYEKNNQGNVTKLYVNDPAGSWGELTNPACIAVAMAVKAVK